MDTGVALLIIGASIIFNGFFLWLIIHLAMRMKRQMWTQKNMLNLLVEIAKKMEATGNFDVENIKLMNNSGSDQFLK